MRLNGHLVWILIPAGLNLIHGCTGPVPEDVGFDFTVQDETLLSGDCFAGLEPTMRECHLLTVASTDLDAEIPTYGGRWVARDVAGRQWYDPLVDNETSAGPGGMRTFRLGFTTGLETDLTTLRWQSVRGETSVDRPIPDQTEG